MFMEFTAEKIWRQRIGANAIIGLKRWRGSVRDVASSATLVEEEGWAGLDTALTGQAGQAGLAGYLNRPTWLSHA